MMPSSAQSISETPACTVGRDGTAAKRSECCLRIVKVSLATRPNPWFDAPCQKDRAMQKSLAFGTTSNPVRHSETLACDVPRGITVGRQLPGIWLSHPTGPLPRSLRKVTTGNVGNAANLIFLRHAPRCAVTPHVVKRVAESAETPSDADSADVSAGLSRAVCD